MADGHEAEWRALTGSVLGNDGHASQELRRAAHSRGTLPLELASLVEKIHRHAYRVTDEDLASLRAKYSEDQLFELIVAAAVGAGEERMRAGLRAVEEA